MRTAIVILAVLLGAAATDAQFGRGRFNARVATPEDYDGAFHFCRVWFRSGMGGDGGNWSVDYPRADINLSIRLAELTKTTVSTASETQPNHLLVRLTDDTLFQCPFVMMTEVGSCTSTSARPRASANLLKGGFLWVDDFWGSYAWSVWASQIRKVFPPGDYPMVDLPPDHPPSIGRSSWWPRRRKFRISASGSGRARRRNEALTAPRCTHARSWIAMVV